VLACGAAIAFAALTTAAPAAPRYCAPIIASRGAPLSVKATMVRVFLS
jgi:hypothetical protein